MGETADALAYKTNVPARARDRLGRAKDSLLGRVRDTMPSGDQVGQVKGQVSQVTGQVAGQVTGQTRQAVGMAQENPLGLAIGAAALGLIVGLVAPASRVEDERLGPVADDLRDRAKEVGQDVLEHGKQVVGDTVEAAKQTAQASGQEHVEQVKETTTDKLDEAATQAKKATSSRPRPARKATA